MTPNDQEILDILEDVYYTRSRAGFAAPPRNEFVYCFRSARASFSRVNPNGPDPREYVEFAREAVRRGDASACIDALSHAKRAIHLAVQSFLQLYSLTRLANKLNFPRQLDLLDEIGAFPTRLMALLNRRRNEAEHEYSAVPEAEAREYVEMAELFVTMCYRYIGGAVVGVYAGKISDERCFEYRIDAVGYTLEVREVEALSRVLAPIGTLHYNIGGTTPRKVIGNVPLDLAHKTEWLPGVNLLVYATRETAFRLPRLGAPGDIVPSEIQFEITNERDQFGRREVKSSETTYAAAAAEQRFR
jgi:hypothetical protein